MQLLPKFWRQTGAHYSRGIALPPSSHPGPTTHEGKTGMIVQWWPSSQVYLSISLVLNISISECRLTDELKLTVLWPLMTQCAIVFSAEASVDMLIKAVYSECVWVPSQTVLIWRALWPPTILLSHCPHTHTHTYRFNNFPSISMVMSLLYRST